MRSPIKNEAQIQAMREGGHILARVLAIAAQNAKPGVTPKDISALASQELRAAGAKPAFLGYAGPPGAISFPDVICISVNDQVQHTIPTDIPFAEGDVVNFDFGVLYKGLITDGGITVGVGQITADDQRLLDGTKAALDAAISILKAGVRVGDVSAAIESVLRKYELGIVRELVGHGVGFELHEELMIPNYGHRGTGPVFKAGMTVAIEPISTLGSHKIAMERDGWTLRTMDGSNSAQFEHTLLVTERGCDILTQ